MVEGFNLGRCRDGEEIALDAGELYLERVVDPAVQGLDQRQDVLPCLVDVAAFPVRLPVRAGAQVVETVAGFHHPAG